MINNNDEFTQLCEKQTGTENIYDGIILHVRRDTVTLPNGKPAIREVIRHNGAVCIVPITDDGKVVVERQFRYPVNEVITEIPAGKLDSKDEDIYDAARRELREETGATARELIYLGKLYPTCAYSDEVIHIFVAKGLTFGERDLDEDEFLNIVTVPFDELLKDIIDGKIPDSKTQSALLRAYYMLNEK